jgi:hypothetical protein
MLGGTDGSNKQTQDWSAGLRIDTEQPANTHSMKSTKRLMLPSTRRRWAVSDNTIVGNRSEVLKGASNCLVFGDACFAYEDGEYVIGERLFGKPIPRRIADWIEEDPEVFVWLIRTLFERVNGIQ